MSMTERVLRRNARRMRSEDRSFVQSVIVHRVDNQARLDWDRLGEDEQLELLDAILQANEDGFALSKLTRRGESLVERLVGVEEGAFAKGRRNEEARRDAAEEAARARRLRLDKGDVANFFSAMGDELVADELWVDDVATLAALLAQFATGRTFAAAARFEGEGVGATLVIDRRMGLWGSRDGEGMLTGWFARLQHLDGQGWLDVEEPGGPEIRIALGDRLLDVLDDTKEA